MLCDDCRQRVSTIIHTGKMEGEQGVLHLCQECADKRGIAAPVFRNPIQVETLLMDMLEQLDAEGGLDQRDQSDCEICTTCGWSFGSMRETGLLGCPHCYTSFENKLMILLQKLHGSDFHLGKVYAGDRTRLDAGEDETILIAALKEAISMEEFEQAAQIRDRLKQVQKQKNP